MEKFFEKTITVPDGISVQVQNNVVKLSVGGKEVQKKFSASAIEIRGDKGTIRVVSKNGKRQTLATANTIASHIMNLYSGLQKDFEYRLEVVYSHFPMGILVKDGFVEIGNIAGAKMPKRAKIVGGAKVVVKGKDITVSAANKEHAGQTAANIEAATKSRGKDKRVFQDGIYIVSKAKHNK
ncbi:MAG: 50S ribosomal protein L6 [archaeon]